MLGAHHPVRDHPRPHADRPGIGYPTGEIGGEGRFAAGEDHSAVLARYEIIDDRYALLIGDTLPIRWVRTKMATIVAMPIHLDVSDVGHDLE